MALLGAKSIAWLFAWASSEPARTFEGPTAVIDDASTVEVKSAIDLERPTTLARVRGRVQRRGQADPVRGAIVFTRSGERIDVEDDGTFTWRGPAGRVAFVVRAAGYEDQRFEVVLEPGQTREVTVFLASSMDAPPYRTVVRGEPMRAASPFSASGEQAAAVAGTGGDPVKAIQSLPGAAQLAGFLPYVVVRGAAPGNTGYVLDGTRVPVLFHIALGPAVIHPRFIDAVDFYAGGVPVRLGRFSSGVIEVRTRAASRDRVRGQVDLRLTDVGALLELPVRRPKSRECRNDARRCRPRPARGSLAFAGRYSYTAWILSLVQSTIRLAFWDYQARFDHDLGRDTELSMFAYGSFDDLREKPPENPSVDDVEPEPLVRYLFHRFDTRIKQRFRTGARATHALVFGWDQSVLDGLLVDQWRIAPRVDVHVPVSKNHSLAFGWDQEFQIFRAPNVALDESTAAIFSDRFVNASGLYLELLWNKSVLELRPGVRADLYLQSGPSPYVVDAQSLTTAIGIDPRVLAKEHVSPRIALLQSIGIYHQPPSSPVPVPALENFGFERGLQRNIQGSFGYELQLAEARVEIVQQAYLGRLSNLQDYELAQALGQVEELEDVVNNVNGWAYGLETLVRLAPSARLFGWLAYTLARSTRDYPTGGHAVSSWDQRHVLNLVANYRLTRKWTFGGRVHFNTGRPYTSIAADESVESALATHRNDGRLPPFFQLDLRLERVWSFQRWQLLGSIDLVNALYAREILACSDQELDPGTLLSRAGHGQRQLMARKGLVGCSPIGFRYVIPTLGLQGRF